MPDILSKLTTPYRLLTKTWRADGTISDYDNAEHFKLTHLTANSIHDLHSHLEILADDPHSFLIRGRYIGSKPNWDVRRKEVYEDQPLHTMLVEIDDYQTPLDTLTNPVQAIDAYIHDRLPPCFQGISYSWSLSCSAGHPTKLGKLKAHVWFWLDIPYTTAQLAAWVKNANLRETMDAAVFRTVQAHYTSRPVFETGVTDPVRVRNGFVQGVLGDNVPLHLDMASLAAVEAPYIKRDSFTANDPLLDWLFEKDLVKSILPGDKQYAVITCPFADEHSTPSKDNDTSTTYMPAGGNGFEQGHFSCLHQHCLDRTDTDFIHKIGYISDKFDDLPPLPVEDTKPSPLQPFLFEPAYLFADRPRPDWIIRDVLPKADLAVIFGESGSGKSFLSLDLAFAVARGVDWNGKKVKQGRVAYICAEGSGDFRNRLRAYVRHNDISKEEFEKIPLQILGAAPNLMDLTQAKALAAAILAQGDVSLVFIDTFAQTTPGANENSGEDVGKALAHCREISKITHSMAVLVHHAGKDLTKGARGWSGLRAAADAEINVSGLEGVREVMISKQKGGEAGLRWGMKLVVIGVDHHEDGAIMNSCAVQYVAPPKKEKKEREMGQVEKISWEILEANGVDEGRRIKKSTLIEEAKVAIAWDGEGKDRRGEVVWRSVRGLEKRGLVEIEGDEIFIRL